ncbi:MAG: TIGR01212 family radical SAM protein [Sulfurospirillum sp.]|nr:TIGR01212 family radical SAM protein [Sulfurospirillum sp.]
MYQSYKSYLQKEYGFELYSIAVDLEFGCPNRDSDGQGGCTFCPSDGARAVQIKDAKSLEEQIQKGIAFAKKRYKAKHFMLYIQAYSGTFATLRQQKEAYEKLLNLYDFKAIAIGTRPDCLGDETLAYLHDLNQKISLHVELGVQTLNDKTLSHINRGHDAKASVDAIKKLKAYGLKVFAHIIVGLPHENRADWSHTVQTLIALKVSGIKFHNLHIIKNTALHVAFQKEPWKIFDAYEYAEELIHLLRMLPCDMVVQRLSSDTPKNDLIAPIWHMQKGQFANYIHQTMHYRFGKSSVDERFWSEEYGEYYYPKSGAIKQARELFIAHSQLEKRLTCKDVYLLDIGFGFGVNSLEALKITSKNTLHVSALDQDARIAKNLPKSIDFIVGDIRYTLKKLDKKYDVIFLDPFCEDKNASMLSVEVFMMLKKLLKKDGVMITSTKEESVRVGCSHAGFKSVVVSHGDIKGLVVTHADEPLNGEPYHDPHLVWSDKMIAAYRNQLKKGS